MRLKSSPRRLAAAFAVSAAFIGTAAAQDETDMPLVLLHPIFAADYTCSEHWEGQLQHLGDARGTDCLVTGLIKTPNGGAFSRTFEGDGAENEQWYSWGETVLAPLSGEVVRMHINSAVNKPGDLGQPPASMIAIRRADGVTVVVAHIAEPTVAQGDTVAAGQPIAIVGNNGFSRSPHIHVGAFRDKTPLQIRWDLRPMAKLRGIEAGETP